MPERDRRRSTGALLVAVSLLLFLAGAFVDPAVNTADTREEQMDRVVAEPDRQRGSHLLYAAAFLLLAIGSLLLLAGAPTFVRGFPSATGWILLFTIAVLLFVMSLFEAFAATNAATRGEFVDFETWHTMTTTGFAFFPFLVLGIALVAIGELRRPDSLTAPWALWLATLTALLSAVGYALVLWFGLDVLAVSAILLFLALAWFAWFTVMLVGAPEPKEWILRHPEARVA